MSRPHYQSTPCTKRPPRHKCIKSSPTESGITSSVPVTTVAAGHGLWRAERADGHPPSCSESYPTRAALVGLVHLLAKQAARECCSSPQPHLSAEFSSTPATALPTSEGGSDAER